MENEGTICGLQKQTKTSGQWKDTKLRNYRAKCKAANGSRNITLTRDFDFLYSLTSLPVHFCNCKVIGWISLNNYNTWCPTPSFQMMPTCLHKTHTICLQCKLEGDNIHFFSQVSSTTLWRHRVNYLLVFDTWHFYGENRKFEGGRWSIRTTHNPSRQADENSTSHQRPMFVEHN